MRSNRRIFTIIVITFMMIFMAACSEKQEKINIRGEIKKISQNEDKKITGIYVEGAKEKDTDHDKASISIRKNTVIYKGNSKDKLKPEDLKEGMKVEVVFEGPIRESYPVQADAKIIRILE